MSQQSSPSFVRHSLALYPAGVIVSNISKTLAIYSGCFIIVLYQYHVMASQLIRRNDSGLGNSNFKGSAVTAEPTCIPTLQVSLSNPSMREKDGAHAAPGSHVSSSAFYRCRGFSS